MKKALGGEKIVQYLESKYADSMHAQKGNQALRYAWFIGYLESMLTHQVIAIMNDRDPFDTNNIK